MPHPTFALDELGQISQGISLNRYQDENGYIKRIINIADLDELYIRDCRNQTRLSASTKFERYQLQNGDVVIAIRGSQPKASVITSEIQGAIAGPNVAFFRSKKKLDINPVYIAVLMRSTAWLENSLNTLSKQSSTSLQAIRVSELRELKVPLPDISTQNQIVKLFLSTERFIKNTQELLDTRKKLTELTMLQLLGGQ